MGNCKNHYWYKWKWLEINLWEKKMNNTWSKRNVQTLFFSFVPGTSDKFVFLPLIRQASGRLHSNPALKLCGFVLPGLLPTSPDHQYLFEKKWASFNCLNFLSALNYMTYFSPEIAPEKSTQRQNKILKTVNISRWN